MSKRPPKTQGRGKNPLVRVVKKLFAYYPVLAPLTACVTAVAILKAMLLFMASFSAFSAACCALRAAFSSSDICGFAGAEEDVTVAVARGAAAAEGAEADARGADERDTAGWAL